VAPWKAGGADQGKHRVWVWYSRTALCDTSQHSNRGRSARRSEKGHGKSQREEYIPRKEEHQCCEKCGNAFSDSHDLARHTSGAYRRGLVAARRAWRCSGGAALVGWRRGVSVRERRNSRKEHASFSHDSPTTAPHSAQPLPTARANPFPHPRSAPTPRHPRRAHPAPSLHELQHRGGPEHHGWPRRAHRDHFQGQGPPLHARSQRAPRGAHRPPRPAAPRNTLAG